MDKLKQWLDIAQNMNGGDFWKNIFDQDMEGFTSPPNRQTSSDFTGMKPTVNVQERKQFPKVDIFENDQDVIVVIDLPGIKKEAIELGINGHYLLVKGNAMPLFPHLKIASSERFYGEFQRQIQLPDEVKSNEISARFWNGVLFVSYKRSTDFGEPIQID
ncbi:MAG: Hsp20/alpha crystallin family protein [Bacillota bacterium]|nr:Hsp20/alpha crystallin family protein [Bacillota bacterium]MDP4170243.1 Hsp20/alpha crystallin family protein [Bacillota bacterium]